MTASWLRYLLALLISFLGVLPTTPARADGIKVLFIAKEATPFSARVRAEVEAMGFELVSSDPLDEQGRISPMRNSQRICRVGCRLRTNWTGAALSPAVRRDSPV